jgi:hypothetical protein
MVPRGNLVAIAVLVSLVAWNLCDVYILHTKNAEIAILKEQLEGANKELSKCSRTMPTNQDQVNAEVTASHAAEANIPQPQSNISDGSRAPPLRFFSFFVFLPNDYLQQQQKFLVASSCAAALPKEGLFRCWLRSYRSLVTEIYEFTVTRRFGKPIAMEIISPFLRNPDWYRLLRIHK